MAEGGFDPYGAFERSKQYPFLNEGGDYDQEPLSTTQPFQPGEASTPYHHGEQIELQTLQHEQTGLPSYEETSFGGDDERTPSFD